MDIPQPFNQNRIANTPATPAKSQSGLRLNGETDRIFESTTYPKPFAFTEEVAAVFDDMVSRSIPYYEESINLLCDWVARRYVDGSRIYDLGCSTGTTIAALLDRFDRPTLEVIAVDSSAPMLEMAQRKLSHLQKQAKIQLVCEDICDTAIVDASVVVMNYTLQFVHVDERPALLRKIWEGLNDGGVFFLSEKIRSEDPRVAHVKTAIYEDFKSTNGYSASEISRKKAALERVLVPFTLQEHIEYMREAGFSAVEPVMLWNNFASFIALK